MVGITVELADLAPGSSLFRRLGVDDPDAFAALFTEDAVYWCSPFRDETRGRDAIVRDRVEGGLGEDSRGVTSRSP